MDIIVAKKPFKLQIATTSQKRSFLKKKKAHFMKSDIALDGLKTMKMTIIMNPRLCAITSTANRKRHYIDQDLIIEQILLLPQWKWLRDDRNMKYKIKQVDFIIGSSQQTARTRTMFILEENESNLRFISSIHVSYDD